MGKRHKMKLVSIKMVAAKLLQQMIDGKKSPCEVREEWPSAEADIDLNCAYHLIDHFEADVDIRKKDQRYDRWQRKQIEKLIINLREPGKDV